MSSDRIVEFRQGHELPCNGPQDSLRVPADRNPAAAITPRPFDTLCEWTKGRAAESLISSRLHPMDLQTMRRWRFLFPAKKLRLSGLAWRYLLRVRVSDHPSTHKSDLGATSLLSEECEPARNVISARPASALPAGLLVVRDWV